MKFILTISTIAIALLANLSAAAEVVIPVDDPFFYPPNGSDWKSLKLGAVIKTRSIPKMPPDFINVVDKAIQVMYRSSNTFDEPVAAITTIFVPTDAKQDKFITYGYPEDSSWPLGKCAFSYAIQTTFGGDDYVKSALNAGIIVNAPDYEGRNDSFCATTLAGKLTLDSMRATLNSASEIGIASNASIGIWGYSGGSVCAGWAHQLHRTYAPELNIAGAAVGGFVANLTAVSVYNNQKLTAGFLPAGLMGIAMEYPAVNEFIENELIPEKEEKFKRVLTQCTAANIGTFLFDQNIFGFFKSGAGVLEGTPLADVLGNSTLAQTDNPPVSPLYVYQGGEDEIVPSDSVDAVVDDYCAIGAHISYNKYPKGSHGSVSTDGKADALQFLLDALEGKDVAPGCATTTITTSTASATASSSATSVATSFSIAPAQASGTPLAKRCFP